MVILPDAGKPTSRITFTTTVILSMQWLGRWVSPRKATPYGVPVPRRGVGPLAPLDPDQYAAGQGGTMGDCEHQAQPLRPSVSDRSTLQ
jgi:hypothetical protein